MEIGVYTFGDLGTDSTSGRRLAPAVRLQQLMEEVTLADQVGLDVFGVGEHHRADYSISAPAVVLAAAAARTTRIRLTSAVTVLGSEDPVRVFQQFATLDLLSNGRAEIMAGRGSFIESFPLFGVDMAEYDPVFREKLDLLLELRDQSRITWSGRYRPAIDGRDIYPRPVQTPLPVWLAVGGTPQSAVRAGELGLPMALAIIGGMPERFKPFVELYRETSERAGHGRLPLGINSHVYVADTSQQAVDEFFAPYAAMMNVIGRERNWPPFDRDAIEAGRARRGALLVGSPAEVVDKILFEHELFGHQRFLAQISMGAVPHQGVLRAIELLGTKVAPEVRRALAPAATSA